MMASITKWTPVAKELPDSEINVLATLEDRRTKEREVSAAYHDGEEWRNDADGLFDRGWKVVAWMDLPEPAQKEEHPL